MIAADGPEIELRDVTFRYRPADDAALRNVSGVVAPGDGLGVIGVNGAGKSTLVKLLNGLLRPSSGRVLVGGRDTREQAVGELAGRVGVVLQDPRSQLFARTVREELAFGPRNLGRPGDEVDAVVARVAGRLDLGDDLETSPFDLPSARRRQVAIASVLTLSPRVLVLDEPTTGADELARRAMVRLLDGLRADGITWVCVSHDVSLLAATATRLLVLDRGTVSAHGPVREVLGNSAALGHAGLAAPQATRLAAALPRLAGRPPARTAAEVVDWLREEPPAAGPGR